MIKTLYRVLFLLFVLAGSLRSSAQTDIGLWTVGSSVADTQLTDIEGDFLDIGFDEKRGYGISFNHFWTPRLSTELSLMTFRANLKISSDLIQEPYVVGELEGRAVTAMAQWHFREGARVQPYLGAGIAHAGGTFDPVEDEEGDVGEIDLESEVTWAASAGLDIRLTDRIYLSFEAKKVAWDANEEGGLPADEIDVDPMLYGSGIRFRF